MDKNKEQYDKLKDYIVKNDAYSQKVKESIMPTLMQAIEQFSAKVKEGKIAQKHKDFVLLTRIRRKLVDREKERQRLREELKGEMGDDYEEEDDTKEDEEDSMFDEEEKEFYDKGMLR